MDFVFWQAGRWRGRTASLDSRVLIITRIYLPRVSTHIKRLCSWFKATLGSRQSRGFWVVDVLLKPHKWLISRASINMAHIKSIKTSTLWHFSVRNPFAIDRSPINQQTRSFFSPFLSVRRCSSICFNTRKKKQRLEWRVETRIKSCNHWAMTKTSETNSETTTTTVLNN